MWKTTRYKFNFHVILKALKIPPTHRIIAMTVYLLLLLLISVIQNVWSINKNINAFPSPSTNWKQRTTTKKWGINSCSFFSEFLYPQTPGEHNVNLIFCGFISHNHNNYQTNKQNQSQHLKQAEYNNKNIKYITHTKRQPAKVGYTWIFCCIRLLRHQSKEKPMAKKKTAKTVWEKQTNHHHEIIHWNIYIFLPWYII